MNLLFIFGTRPEAIKLAPVIKECRQRADIFSLSICNTAQHQQMLDQVLHFFDITPDYDLDLMQKDQSLFQFSSDCLRAMEKVLAEQKPDYVVIQGDTTTAFIGALSCFYGKIKVVHIEAGLRSFNNQSPFPEEINRKLISHIADIHFAPTKRAVENLQREGICKNVWLVGNTVIDALFLGLESLRKQDKNIFYAEYGQIDFSKRIILITLHRRESFGKTFEEICFALKAIAQQNDSIELVYPVHLNPNVREPAFRILGNEPNIHLLEPLDYPRMIWFMSRCHMALTDSGGIQEEAPSLGKPVLILRDVTERLEGIEAGTAKLTGTKKDNIIRDTELLLTDDVAYRSMAGARNPYGDGTASKKIADILQRLAG